MLLRSSMPLQGESETLKRPFTRRRQVKTEAESIHRTLVEEEEAARRVEEAASSPELNAAFGGGFTTAVKDLMSSLRELQSIDLWAIRDKQEDISVVARRLAALQQQVSEARARFDRAKTLDQMRRSAMLKLSDAVRQFSRPENRARLSPGGVATVTDLQTLFDTLSKLDNVPLIVRPDYSETLAAADDAFGRAQTAIVDMQQLAELTGGVRRVTDKIDKRGRSLLDEPTSSQLAGLSNSVKSLGAAKLPLSSDERRQLVAARANLDQFEQSVAAVMDREEKKSLMRTLPTRQGSWEFMFDRDKMTDEERVQAVGHVEASQAKYELSVICRRTGPEFLIATFQSQGTESKRIPWHIDITGPAVSEPIRLRIDSDPALAVRFTLRSYGNQGEVDVRAALNKILRSSRLVFADIFPDEQVEVPTSYPKEFVRLCELLTQRTGGFTSR
jgi:hypothetical protein